MNCTMCPSTRRSSRQSLRHARISTLAWSRCFVSLNKCSHAYCHFQDDNDDYAMWWCCVVADFPRESLRARAHNFLCFLLEDNSDFNQSGMLLFIGRCRVHYILCNPPLLSSTAIRFSCARLKHSDVYSFTPDNKNKDCITECTHENWTGHSLRFRPAPFSIIYTRLTSTEFFSRLIHSVPLAYRSGNGDAWNFFLSPKWVLFLVHMCVCVRCLCCVHGCKRTKKFSMNDELSRTGWSISQVQGQSIKNFAIKNAFNGNIHEFRPKSCTTILPWIKIPHSYRRSPCQSTYLYYSTIPRTNTHIFIPFAVEGKQMWNFH